MRDFLVWCGHNCTSCSWPWLVRAPWAPPGPSCRASSPLWNGWENMNTAARCFNEMTVPDWTAPLDTLLGRDPRSLHTSCKSCTCPLSMQPLLWGEARDTGSRNFPCVFIRRSNMTVSLAHPQYLLCLFSCKENMHHKVCSKYFYGWKKFYFSLTFKTHKNLIFSGLGCLFYLIINVSEWKILK